MEKVFERQKAPANGIIYFGIFPAGIIGRIEIIIGYYPLYEKEFLQMMKKIKVLFTVVEGQGMTKCYSALGSTAAAVIWAEN